MYTYKISNPNHIKRLLESSISPDEVAELTIKVNDIDTFLTGMLSEIKEDPDWPLAANPALIIDPDNEEETKIRARNIMDLVVDQDPYGLKFLDFGCGIGYVAHEALERGASIAVGYDIKSHDSWQNLNTERLNLTMEWTDVVAKAPYDIILLYDVMDHIIDRDPGEVLSELARLLATDGHIVMRCHPWISRHGTHLYQQGLNRAFAHVIFSDEQLIAAGYNQMPTRKIVHPMMIYKNWIDKAKLRIVKEDKIQEPVEDYFLKNDLMKKLIQKHYNDSPMPEYRDGKGDLARVMSFHFVDFILRR